MLIHIFIHLFDVWLSFCHNPLMSTLHTAVTTATAIHGIISDPKVLAPMAMQPPMAIITMIVDNMIMNLRILCFGRCKSLENLYLSCCDKYQLARNFARLRHKII